MLECLCRVIWSNYLFFKIKSLSISLNVWDWWWSQSQSQFLRPKTKVSVSVSIFETNFIKSQSQSQNLIPIEKVSVSVSKIETGYTESQSQSQHAKTGLAHPWFKLFEYSNWRKKIFDLTQQELLTSFFENRKSLLFFRKLSHFPRCSI